MSFVFISGGLPTDVLDQSKDEFASGSVKYVQQWWDYSMATALHKCLEDEFFAVSFPPVATYPIDKCIVYSGKELSIYNGFKIYIPSTVNLPILKQISLIFGIFRRLRYIVKKSHDKVYVLTHCIYPQSAIPAFIVRKMYGIKVFTIVPDLPEHSVASRFKGYPFLKWLYGIYRWISKKVKYGYDGYICFAKPQMQYLNTRKPYMIMEGFVDTHLFDKIQLEKNDNYRIVYAGGIYYRYGMKELVDGFIQAQLPNTELYIYGQGDAVDYVLGKEENKVFYGGCLSRNEIISIEKSASLLINPRPTTEDFSRCSFPSKIMEYLATEVPVLTTKLGCFSEEYDELLNYIYDESVEGIAAAIRYCWENQSNLKDKAVKAAQHIRDYKNVDYQAIRIMKFIING